MELMDAIVGRRSIRRYKKEVPKMELIKQCIEAACYAPSSHDSQPWKFVIITDKNKIEALSKTQIYSAFLKNAPMVVVVLADEKASPNHWIEDCSCAAILLMLKAHKLGLGTCWNAVHHPKDRGREEHVLGVLGIKGCRVLANIGIGYPDEKPGKKIIKRTEEVIL